MPKTIYFIILTHEPRIKYYDFSPSRYFEFLLHKAQAIYINMQLLLNKIKSVSVLDLSLQIDFNQARKLKCL